MTTGVVRRPLPRSGHPGLKCTLGDPELDRFLRGGIPCGSITEIVGEASAGKTQTCMQLLMTVQWAKDRGGLDGSALYIYTEGDPPLARLAELARHQNPGADDPRDHVYVEKGVTNGEKLLRVVERIERQLLQQTLPRRLRLIIIDSIANVFRDVGDSAGRGAYTERAGMLFRIAALLKRYADQYQLAVLCVNQVSDVMKGLNGASRAPTHTGGLQLYSSGREVQPALALAWTTCVNHRIFVSRDPHPFVVAHADGLHTRKQVLRQFQVVFSPYLPQNSCHFLVEQRGLRSIAAQDVQQGFEWAAELEQQSAVAEHREEQRIQEEEQLEEQRSKQRAVQRQRVEGQWLGGQYGQH